MTCDPNDTQCLVGQLEFYSHMQVVALCVMLIGVALLLVARVAQFIMRRRTVGKP